MLPRSLTTKRKFKGWLNLLTMHHCTNRLFSNIHVSAVGMKSKESKDLCESLMAELQFLVEETLVYSDLFRCKMYELTY